MQLLPTFIFAILASVVVSQTSTFPTASLPTPPPNSHSDLITLISNIPTCWSPCMGGAINFVCHSNDTWSCACNNYFNTTSTSPDFTQLESYDGDCQNCSQNVGVSDGAEQSIEGFLVNICIALPDVTSAVTASVSPSPTSTSAAPKNSKSGVATREDPSLAFLEVSFVLGCMVF